MCVHSNIRHDYRVHNYLFWGTDKYAYTYFYTSSLVMVFGLFGGNLGGPQRDPNYQAQIWDGIPRTWSAPALGIAAASALAFGQV